MKVAVEVVEASDLMPKDGQGAASPFVEVDFNGQRRRTQTKHRELNPSWRETLLFDVSDPDFDLANSTIDVSVYHDRQSSAAAAAAAANHHHRNFLGRVRISGATVAPFSGEAPIQRCPLEKRGIFSHIRGDISLCIYTLEDPPDLPSFPTAAAAIVNDGEPPSKPQEPNYTTENPPPTTPKKKSEERRVFHSVGHEKKHPHPHPPQPPPAAVKVDRVAAPPPAAMMHMHGHPGPGPGPRLPPPEYGLVETSPPLAGRLGYRGDKMSSTYDLVEPMHYLYVNVVKARELPSMDVTGSLDPYVEVKLGNYKGVTKAIEKNSNPAWRQVFAFSKDRLQANLLEVTVKDRDLLKDDFVGRLVFDLTDVPLRVPPDSPLAPQWYRLEDKRGDKSSGRGEIMLAVWMGTQADESFPDAWHSDAHSVTGVEGLNNTRSKVYFSPKLCYLRVHVIEAQDLVPSDHTRFPDAFVKIQLGHQLRRTRPARSVNPSWGEEVMVVASEPFDEPLVISVEDRVGNKDEQLGRMILPIASAPQRGEHGKPVEPRWFSLSRPSASMEDAAAVSSNAKFSSKIHLRVYLDTGYHVLDESTHYSSDFRPANKHLRKPSIGILELGILSARNLVPMKAKDGRTTDAYCVAKYGPKWVRTRTLLNTLAPRWNEQYTWEVFDPCTVVTVGVFDNCHIAGGNNSDARDQRIGKVRIRLSTLETNRIYTHYYPLLVLQPSGLKKTGELHLAVRFTCMAWVNMVTLYSKPLLPKMHYTQPIPVLQLDYLRHQAMQIVAARLARAEPPLRREVVEYMLDVDSHMWSLRRSKANFYRITAVLSGAAAIARWLDTIRNWRNPITTVLVHVLFLILVCYPELILPTVFLYLFMIGMWNYRFRPRKPSHMDTKLSHAEWASPEELDEEFDTFPTTKGSDVVRMRYDRLRSLAGRVQTVVGDLATQGERAQALLSWRDPRATAIFILFALVVAVFLYVTPFQVVAVVVGLYLLRHPKFRTKMPSVPFNFYRRLPAKSDMLI